MVLLLEEMDRDHIQCVCDKGTIVMCVAVIDCFDVT